MLAVEKSFNLLATFSFEALFAAAFRDRDLLYALRASTEVCSRLEAVRVARCSRNDGLAKPATLPIPKVL